MSAPMPPQLLQVRCCCQPKRLLGYLPVDVDKALEGAHIKFALNPPSGGEERFVRAIERWSDQAAFLEFPVYVALPIARFGSYDEASGGPFWRLAIKSEETPLEVLRRIPGFIEA